MSNNLITLSENMSKRINCLRFILALGVVFIHNDMRKITHMGVAIIIPDYINIMYSIFDAITMISVPLFFFFAGYFVFLKSYSFSLLIKKKTQQILIPYIFWICIIIILYYIAQSTSVMRPFFSQPYNIIRNFTFIDWIDIFWGKINRPGGVPIVPQFWFLRDLFILTILYPFLKRLIDFLPIFTITVSLYFFVMDSNIFIVRSDALFFFCLSGVIVKNNINLEEVDKIKYLDVLLVYVIAAILYIFVPSFSQIASSITILSGMLLLLKLSEYLIMNSRVYSFFSYMSKYAFWLYSVHLLIVQSLAKLFLYFFPINSFTLVFEYFFVVFIALAISILTGAFFKNYLPFLFSILTGSR